MSTRGEARKVVRCAVYTRKSSEEGLALEFNSLDAQREAAEAFVASQRAEGWVCLPERYDDGGFSGGNMDRPALAKLLRDIDDGRVDCVVVYKVDRLSRSLMDFARIMEAFDRRGVSFVSVTQQFNTTHSMGRLTLNVLLSFAQFEREIIGERIRDKIAAQRRRGKWTGGVPVLGYDVDRSGPSPKLVVNAAEAARVTAIFNLYLEHGALLTVVRELRRRDWRTKSRTTKAGRAVGGEPFDKCRLHGLLTNPLYAGKIRHKAEVYPGEHEAVVDAGTFARVQAMLAEMRLAWERARAAAVAEERKVAESKRKTQEARLAELRHQAKKKDGVEFANAMNAIAAAEAELVEIPEPPRLFAQDCTPEAAFAAEYQNEPLSETADDGSDLMTVDAIAGKTNGFKRGRVPPGVTHLTMFVDVQGSLLYWMVCGWQEDFTGYVLDYGAYPDPKRAYFTLRDVKRTIQSVHTGTGQEGAIYAALEALTGQYLAREWLKDDGGAMKVTRCLVDANWGASTDVVYMFCRQSPHAAVLTPSHGKYVGAASNPFGDARRRQGDRVGLHWRIPGSVKGGHRSVRYVLTDTNYWKSFVHARLAVAMGDAGCLSLFAAGGHDHRLLAEHLTSEYRVKTTGRGRTVDEWKIRTPGADNHWLDALVGCAVGASMQGAVLFGTDARPRVGKRIKLSEIQRQKEGRGWRAGEGRGEPAAARPNALR